MDPFSIIVSTASIVDICVRLVTFLQDFHEAAAKVEAGISALQQELEAIIAVNISIRTLFKEELEKAKSKQEQQKGSPRVPPDDSYPVQNLWRDIGRNLKGCEAVVERLEKLVEEIVGKERAAKESSKIVQKLEGFRKLKRKDSRESDIRQLREQLTTFQRALQMLMTAITTSYTRGIQTTADQTNRSIDELTGNVRALDLSLQNQIDTLKPLIQSPDVYNLRSSVQSASAIASLASPNKHFDIPQTVSSIFTGREASLQELKNTLTTPRSPGQRQTQKRLIIYGLGGSGKTQFCCKFAQENRMNFWAIFWIDGSSEVQATQTFSKIAKIGGVEPNKAAAKNWLSNLEHSWLLIIDNADDPRTPIEEYFPEGERGHILVTTRNPALQVHGTVGARSFHFEQLKDDEATNLLLKAANKPSPWDVRTLELASAITKSLGFLPLALVHAGRAIMNGFCTLGNYITSYDMNWQRVRRSRSSSSVHEDEGNMYLNIYSSYEVIYLGLEGKDTQAAKDAIELLKTFSFLHRENIRVDFLTRAALNPAAEREEEEKQKQNVINTNQTSKTRTQAFEETKFALLMFLLKDRSPAVLPKVLRDTEELGFFDDHRLRMALKELTQMSLITYNYTTDSFSMHPLVHTWVRDRPKMSTPEQAIWCQAAATTLAQSILLPPLGSSEADEDLRRDLLPHVEHVQRCQKAVSQLIKENQKQRKRPWPVLGPRFGRPEALRLAKFSLVYAQCGRWDVAEQLQLQVKDFVCAMLGPEHPRAIDIMLALSGTYWQLGRGNEAADMQAKVLQICKSSLGEEHPKTFRVMDTLGVSRWLQGRFKDALKLHQRAIEGLTSVLGPEHEDTLKAIANLGRVEDKFYRFNEAKALHKVAVDGMKKTLGPTHLETLIAMDNLAMTYLSIGGDYLIPAQNLLEEVLDLRKKKLGKEHPYTLWAMCNLARVETALGDLEQAEDRIRAGLAVAERNLGPDHIGTLYGKVHLAQVLVTREHYEEAEAIFLHVIERHKYMSSATNSLHPDRISAMLYLFQCYQLQNKVEDALRLAEEISEGLRVIGAQDHPLAKQLSDAQMELRGLSVRRRGPVVAPVDAEDIPS
ncbi:MAG: hypothetical protein FRX48_02200 [Lasallia pustulata]|uniref:NB-ARC domain-containing protein n=1 Tax=Lasallia pustulata TaxID=136370 RepID=A0A5M8PYN2_9LECA|nr:MAG: hypothetical protein FRX48_02200 [Lasallia pustulata]